MTNASAQISPVRWDVHFEDNELVGHWVWDDEYGRVSQVKLHTPHGIFHVYDGRTHWKYCVAEKGV